MRDLLSESETGEMPEKLFTITFTSIDIEDIADAAGVDRSVALDRARSWATEVQGAAIDYCNRQLDSIVQTNQP